LNTTVSHDRSQSTCAPPPVVAAAVITPAPAADATVSFASLPIDERLQRAITTLGFTETTAVQAAVFAPVLAGADVIAGAQTGTGKTIAFLLPMLQRMLSAPGRTGHTRALILAPTRELAQQIEDDVRGLARHTRLSGVSVYGGVGMRPQARALRDGVDIVVATPGRLLDHIRSGQSRFTQVQMLVLDEADRMLDMGFWPDVQRIVAALPATRQTLLFSATTSSDVVKAAKQLMKDPQSIQIGQATGLSGAITHTKHEVRADQKQSWLDGFLKSTPGHALVFVRTKHRADRITRRLEEAGIRCAPLHGNRSQGQRSAAVESFKAGHVRVLVATDVAARGLDVDDIKHVINFEVPVTSDAYVHRVGRTGRASASGTAVTLVAPEEAGALRALERTLKLRLAPHAGGAVLTHAQVSTARR
jgi:ATP-dependent RNA helicase RhlE